MGGLSINPNTDPQYDPTDPLHLKIRRPLSSSAPTPSIAQGSASPGFTVGAPPSWQQPLGGGPNPGAFSPDLSASGPASLGTSQPTPPSRGTPRAGAMAPMRMPPPGTDLGPPPRYQSPLQPPNADLAMQAVGTGVPQAPPPGPPTEAASAKAAPKTPATAGLPADNWATRLGMALLSTTRLAPIASQIIHPKWSAEVARQQRELAAGKTGAEIQEAQARAAQAQATAETTMAQGRLRPIALKDGSLYDPRTGQIVHNSPTVSQELQEFLDAGYDEDTARVAILAKHGVKVPEDKSLQVLQSEYPELAGFKPDANNYISVPASTLNEVIRGRTTNKSLPVEQQYINDYLARNPGKTIQDAIRQHAIDNQAPQRAPLPAPVNFIDPATHRMVSVGPGGTVPEGAQTPAGVNTMNTPTSQSRSMAEMAQTVTQQVPDLLSQIDALKAKIGPAAGRWNQMWVNRAGMNDPDFAGLDQDLDLFASALVRTHFGARGGQGYREALKKDFSMAQSPEDLKARIQHADQWLTGYANMTKPGGAPPTPAAPRPTTPQTPTPTTPASAAVDALVGKYK